MVDQVGTINKLMIDILPSYFPTYGQLPSMSGHLPTGKMYYQGWTHPLAVF
jgi:hypothetical protein